MFALISLAFAVDTVVYPGGDPASSLKRVTDATGVASADLHALSVSELMANKAPTMVTGGHLAVCSGAPSSGDTVKQSLSLAEGAIKYMEYGSARAALDAAIKDLGCLQSPVDAAQASRAFYLRGIVNAASGDQATSRDDFRRARLFAPTMVWDENFAPAARGTFDAIANEVKTAALVSLTVLPTPADGAVRIDGRPVQLIDGHTGLSVGDHYVQVGDKPAVTFTLSVDGSTPPTLVVPSAVGPDVLDWASDGEKRAALSAVLVSALGSEGTVYVVNPKVVWRVKLGGAAWDLVDMSGAVATSPTQPQPVSKTPLKTEPLPTAPLSTPAAKKKSPVGPVLLGVGGAAGLTGGVVGYLGFRKAQAAHTRYVARLDEGEVVDPSDETDADVKNYVGGGRQETIGFVIAGVGGAILLTGVVVTIAF